MSSGWVSKANRVTGILQACCASLLYLLATSTPAAAQFIRLPEMPPEQLGHLLFTREWQERDSRAPDGDGLGPMFNARSCVACHNQGGTGGSGSLDKNVELLCLVPLQPFTRINRQAFVAEVRNVHPSFVVDETTALTFVTLHKFSTHPRYDQWRKALVTRSSATSHAKLGGWMRLRLFGRRTPSLFGVGLIDSIPDEVLHKAALKQMAGGRIRGRVAVATDGHAGRFGWRGQTSSLKQFVVGACANELGLHVPNSNQASDPLELSATQPGLDMDDAQCSALVSFVAGLPAPVARTPASAREREYWRAGEQTFERLGCNTCHVPTLGRVAGIYSDLLLHDMGSELSDPAGANAQRDGGLTVAVNTSVYYGGPTDVFAAVPPETQRQWRTTPLWNLEAGGPYLHDGRAATVDEAIAHHAGEASTSRNKYVALSSQERTRLLSYLYSLGVPPGSPPTASGEPNLAQK